jgi:hypothetical protein
LLYHCEFFTEINPKPEKKGRMMGNRKSELSETVEAVSKYVGTLAGKVVVSSKEFVDCIKNLATTKPEPKKELSRASVESQAKEQPAEVKKKKATGKQARPKK